MSKEKRPRNDTDKKEEPDGYSAVEMNTNLYDFNDYDDNMSDISMDCSPQQNTSSSLKNTMHQNYLNGMYSDEEERTSPPPPPPINYMSGNYDSDDEIKNAFKNLSISHNNRFEGMLNPMDFSNDY